LSFISPAGMKSPRRTTMAIDVPTKPLPFQRVDFCGHRKEKDSWLGVYLLDPAIEACFRTLGIDGVAREMKLHIKRDYLPRVDTLADDPIRYGEYSFNERRRREFAPHVNLLSTGIGKQHMFSRRVEEIRGKGLGDSENEG